MTQFELICIILLRLSLGIIEKERLCELDNDDSST